MGCVPTFRITSRWGSDSTLSVHELEDQTPGCKRRPKQQQRDFEDLREDHKAEDPEAPCC